MHFAVDKIFLTKWNNIKFHLMFWVAMIAYEVPLAGFISGHWGNFWDYLLHYLIDIGLFYFHSLYALKQSKKGYAISIFWIIGEVSICYLCNIVLFYIFSALGVRLVFNQLSAVFFLASTYRFIFILLISTAYWYMLQRIQSLKKIQQQQSLIFASELKNKQLQNAMLEEQLSKQKASIVPHFLFNTLHILYHQLRKDKPQAAQHLLSLSEMMQYNLSPLDQQYKVPLSHELSYVKNYIDLRRLERDYALDLLIDIPENEADELQIIPLVLATLIENVFHHGDLYQKQHPAFISMRLNGQKQLRIFIKNKIKLPVSTKNGIGIANMLSRLAYFYPEQHQYHCDSSSRSYTQKLIINL